MSIFRQFLPEDDGQALAFFVISMPAFIGLSLLAVDIGRGNNLHYDLQKAVDSLALAAAAELDGSPDAITRANAAVSGELVNRTRFDDEADPYLGLDLANVTVTYLCELPADDDMPIDTRDCDNGGHVTTNSLIATFAWVEARGANAVDYTTIFPVSFATGSATLPVAAEAVAGFEQVVCKATPIFMCNPWDRDDLQDPDRIYDLVDPAMRGNGYGLQMTFRAKGGGGSQPFAGNFGFLTDPNRGNGAAELRETFANILGTGCFRSRGVDTEPGFKATITDAINVRMDIYEGALGGATYTKNANYRSAMNVRKGDTDGNACNYTKTENPETDGVIGFPRDAENSWDSTQGGAIGNGVWDFDMYARINYPDANIVDPDTGEVVGNSMADIVTARYGGPPTRYEVWTYENDPNDDGILGDNIAAMESIGPDGAPGGGDGEVGAPQCNQTGTGINDPNRRSIYGAIINCKEYEAYAEQVDAKTSGRMINIPVYRWGEFFLTEPVKKGGGTNADDGELFVELINIFDLDNNTSFQRNEAVLYR